MHLYSLLIFLSIFGAIKTAAMQDSNQCPFMKLPMGTIAHVLSYVISAARHDGRGFFLSRTLNARSFLTTCKYYHTSKELTRSLIAQMAQKYASTSAFVFAPLYLATPTAYTCLQEWLQTTSVVKVILWEELITSEGKMEFLDAFVEHLTNPADPGFYRYTAAQKNYLCSKIMAIKSLAQQNCLAGQKPLF